MMLIALMEYARFFGKALWPPNWIRLAMDLRAERKWQKHRHEIMPKVSADLVEQIRTLEKQLRDKKRARLTKELEQLGPNDPQRAVLERALAALDEPATK